MPRRTEPFVAGNYYHLYNRGNNGEQIFFLPEDYQHFLHRCQECLLPVMGIVAYCLIPNHYHLLVQIKPAAPGTDEMSNAVTTAAVSRGMTRVGISYSKGFNARMKRTGVVFEHRFQARRVDDDTYLAGLSRYIHLNPVVAGIAAHPRDWVYSSYRAYERVAFTLVRTEPVLELFPSRQAYCEFVCHPPDGEAERLAHLTID